MGTQANSNIIWGGNAFALRIRERKGKTTKEKRRSETFREEGVFQWKQRVPKKRKESRPPAGRGKAAIERSAKGGGGGGPRKKAACQSRQGRLLFMEKAHLSSLPRERWMKVLSMEA